MSQQYFAKIIDIKKSLKKKKTSHYRLCMIDIKSQWHNDTTDLGQYWFW